MNWRTIFLVATLVLFSLPAIITVADGDDDTIADNITECTELWTECLQEAALESLAWEKFIDFLYDRMMKACDALYKNCMKSNIRIPRPGPITIPIPGEKWLICQGALRTCQGVAWALKAAANLVRQRNAGAAGDLCNDAWTECLLRAINPFD